MRRIALLLILICCVPIVSAQETSDRHMDADTKNTAASFRQPRSDTTATESALAGRFIGLRIGDSYIVNLQDGSRLHGTLIHEGDKKITLSTTVGAVTIPRDKIKTLSRLDSRRIRNGEYWYPDPNQSRALVMPTASTLPQGKAFYENYYLIFNSIHVGVTDQVMFSFGFVPFPGAAILTFGPKIRIYQHPAQTFEAAVGGHFYVGTDGDDSVTLFVPYGVLGFGNPARGRLNVGVGGLVVEREREAFLNLSGDLRASQHVKLMGELFILSDDRETHVFPLYGLRFFSEKTAFDLGFFNIPDEKDLTVFGTPLVNFVYQF